jgi:S-adenosylmethionine hydrolase
MPDPIITLTTDFGEDSPYVAAMKGVILGINPHARLVDLSHQIPPQHLQHAAFFVATALPAFPPGIIHLVVVDPGVGSDRALLCVELDGQRLLVPDNGCWTEWARRSTGQPAVHCVAEPRYWRQPVSATFHGRDILAPAAGWLSLGIDPAALGPPAADWVHLNMPAPERDPDGWTGEVVFVDRFGNLITNIPGDAITDSSNAHAQVAVGLHMVAQRVRTYAEAARGTTVALIGSTGMLEIAVVQGNAARSLQAASGTPVTVRSAND